MYDKIAAYYDSIMSEVDYENWVAYLEKIFEKYNFSPLRILDMACGTGTVSVKLKRLGYEVVGLDESRDMIDIAREKAESTGLKIKFVQQDIRNLGLSTSFDCVVCLFDSLNYVTQDDDLKQVFKKVRAVLVKKGIFIFDTLSPERIKEATRQDHVARGDDFIACFENSYDEEKRIGTVRLTLFAQQTGDTYKKFEEVHEEKAYTIKELTSWLEEAGFFVLCAFDAYTFEEPKEDSKRVFFVAKRE